jgi:hypothetical protein
MTLQYLVLSILLNIYKIIPHFLDLKSQIFQKKYQASATAVATPDGPEIPGELLVQMFIHKKEE